MDEHVSDTEQEQLMATLKDAENLCDHVRDVFQRAIVEIHSLRAIIKDRDEMIADLRNKVIKLTPLAESWQRYQIEYLRTSPMASGVR